MLFHLFTTLSLPFILQMIQSLYIAKNHVLEFPKRRLALLKCLEQFSNKRGFL